MEKIEILTLLSTDRDAEISQQALRTLRNWDSPELDQVLSDPATPSEVIDFVFDDMVKELDEASARSPASPGELATPAETHSEGGWTSSMSGYSDPGAYPQSEAERAPVGAAEIDAKQETLLQRIARMTVAEKVRLARIGTQEGRLVLIRDPNRVVVRSAVESPKVSDSEAESFAAMRNVREEVLRIISKNRAFIKNPAVIRALVFNPRSPIDVSLPLIKLLKDRDLKLLTFDKNVPDPVRASALRLYATRTQSQSR